MWKAPCCNYIHKMVSHDHHAPVSQEAGEGADVYSRLALDAFPPVACMQTSTDCGYQVPDFLLRM